MYSTRRDISDALDAEIRILSALLHGYATSEQSAASVIRNAKEGDWSVIEVTCHLRDTAERALDRMRQMRDRDEPLLAGYDQDAWARERRYAADDLSAVLSDFNERCRQYMLELGALPDAAWDRTGRHEEEGVVTIRGHALHQVAHIADHIAQIARLLTGSDLKQLDTSKPR